MNNCRIKYNMYLLVKYLTKFYNDNYTVCVGQQTPSQSQANQLLLLISQHWLAFELITLNKTIQTSTNTKVAL
jgi:hypothetical protein